MPASKPATNFEIEDRVRVSDAYAAEHQLWKMDDFKTLRNRLGTVVTFLPPLVEVLFDRKHKRGRDILVAFHNPDTLELVERPRRKRT